MLLAIDTATHLAGIALHDAHGSRGMIQWRTARNHTVELLPNIVALLAQTDVSARGVHAIVVANGPGSYTGLRIGLSVAKGFCLAHGAALVAVPTLAVSAHTYEPNDPSAGSGQVLCAMLQAGRGRLAVQVYHAVDNAWQATGASFLGHADELATRIEQFGVEVLAGSRESAKAYTPTMISAQTVIGAIFFAGEVDNATETVLRARLGARATFAPVSERARDPRVLARVGWQKWQRGETENIETLAPVYQ